MTKAAGYCESYANSAQARVSVWDFFLAFGIVHQDAPDRVEIENTHGVYLSPQQAKALWNLLGQNLAQYEQTFGEISLEPQGAAISVPPGPVH
jgi:flagellar protein FlaG